MNNKVTDFKPQFRQKLLISIILLLVSFTPVLLFVKSISYGIFKIDTNIDTYIFYIILYMFIIVVLIKYIRRVRIDVIFILFIYAASLLLTAVFHRENFYYIFTLYGDLLNNPIYVFLVYGLLIYMLSREITDYYLFYRFSVNLSVVIIFFSSITFIVNFKNQIEFDYMSFSYNLLPFVLLLIFNKNHNMYLKIITFIGFLLIFFSGARGALIFGLLGYVWSIFSRKNKTYFSILVSLSLLIFLLILGFYYDSFIEIINSMLLVFDIQSRNINYLVEGIFLSDSGRISIALSLLNNISLLGQGIFGDRVLLSGTYAHNLIIEILYQFGVIFGTVIIIMLFSIISMGFIKSYGPLKSILKVLLITGFLKLMISGSYLSNEPLFFILLAFSVNAIGNKVENNAIIIQKVGY